MECPVCEQEVGDFEICETCGYQNSGEGEQLDDPPGPNLMTLREAQAAYEAGSEIC